ncbi:MAG: FKBP-type peptidyl-prolyl cis-trans isomerase [Prevotellaceae bacterium]|nr:FKBP-type peptidyl-prolyl cis-trans isomerase [Prevotellaceae bacterium]
MKNMKKNVCILAVMWLFASCAKEQTINNDEYEQQRIDAYLTVNDGAYPDWRKTESGAYILSQTKTSGKSPLTDNIVYVRYTVRIFDESIISSSVDSIALLLGAHSNATYYGPRLLMLTDNVIMSGLKDAILTLKEGEKARILLPSWLSSIAGTRAYSYPILYDLELLRVIPDIEQFQSDSLKSYRDNHYPGADAIRSNLYYHTLVQGSGEPPQSDDTVKVLYMGTLLDGFMFDTNIRDSAKVHRGKNYDASATYDTLTVIVTDSISDMSVIPGFAHTLKKMKQGEEAIAFFSSDYGYAAQTSGQIQPYSMLCFYIKMTYLGVKKEDTEDTE